MDFETKQILMPQVVVGFTFQKKKCLKTCQKLSFAFVYSLNIKKSLEILEWHTIKLRKVGDFFLQD